MKKVCMMLAAFGAFSLIAGEFLDVNGTFAGSEVGDKVPKGWVYNLSTKPTGAGEVVKVGDGLGLKVSNDKGVLHYNTKPAFPIKPGEVYKVTVKATGTGTVDAGIYLLDEKTAWILGVYNKPQKLKEGENVIEREFTVPEEARGKTPATARFSFLVSGKTEAVFSDFKVEKVK